jgi:glycosyltransferase involved in cell wall biosynthesis
VDEALWRISIYYPMMALNELGQPATCFNVSLQEADLADVFIFYRCVTSAALSAMRRLKKDKLVVYAIDDYLFQPDCRFKWKISPADYLDFFAAADAVMVSSSRLLSHVSAPQKFRYHTMIDRESFALLGGGKKQDGQPFTIGWLAGNNHGMDEFVAKMLTILDGRLEAHEQCIFHRFGKHFLSGQYAHLKVVDNAYIEVNQWRDLYRKFASLGLDLSIAPLLESDEFFNCKSESKWVEAGALGIPLLASRMAQFTEVIQEGKNGFLASTPEEFADKIVFLMRNPQLGRAVGLAARAQVEKECLSITRTQQLLDNLRQIKKESSQ